MSDNVCLVDAVLLQRFRAAYTNGVFVTKVVKQPRSNRHIFMIGKNGFLISCISKKMFGTACTYKYIVESTKQNIALISSCLASFHIFIFVISACSRRRKKQALTHCSS